MKQGCAKVFLVPITAVSGRTFRIEHAARGGVVSYVTLTEDGTAYCYRCRDGTCRHVRYVAEHAFEPAA